MCVNEGRIADTRWNVVVDPSMLVIGMFYVFGFGQLLRKLASCSGNPRCDPKMIEGCGPERSTMHSSRWRAQSLTINARPFFGVSSKRRPETGMGLRTVVARW